MRKGKLNIKANTWKEWSNQDQCKLDLTPSRSRRAVTYILAASLGCEQSCGSGMKQLSIRAASQTQHRSAPQSRSPFLAVSAKNYCAPHPPKHLTLPTFTQKLVEFLFVFCWWLFRDYRDNTLIIFQHHKHLSLMRTRLEKAQLCSMDKLGNFTELGPKPYGWGVTRAKLEGLASRAAESNRDNLLQSRWDSQIWTRT